MKILRVSMAIVSIMFVGLCNAKSIVDCTSKSSLNDLIAKNSMVVVDFHGERFCMPCKRMARPFEELSSEFPEVQFVKINTESVHDFDSEIRSVPTFYFYKGGTKVNSFSGAKGKGYLKNIVKSSFGLQ